MFGVITNPVVERFLLQEFSGAAQQLVGGFARERFPTMQDFTQRMARQRPDHGVNMVRHYNPRTQFVALAVEMFQCVGDQTCDFWFAQPARTVAGVQQCLNLVAISR
jgi:hypothetical protein